jgi:hypothetical protein
MHLQYKYLVGVLLMSVLLPQSGRAQTAVPDGLPATQKAEFADRRVELTQQYATLDQRIARFNSRCGSVSEDSPLIAECEREQAAIRAAKASYKEASGRYERDLAAAMASARAALPAAKIFAHGEFYFVTKDGLKVTGTDGTMLPLDSGTRIVTGPNTVLKLLLPDETILTLFPNSDMVIDDFVYDPVNSATMAEARIAKGIFRWVTGKVSHKKDVNIKIPVGTIGIRGTDFEAMVEPSGAGYVKLFDGQLDITESKTGATLKLSAGQMISFTADGTFSPLTPLKQESRK